MLRRTCVCFVILLFVSGCSWLKSQPKSSLSKPNTPSYVESGKILDRPRLLKGGTIAIVPFKAGPDVEASEELDKVALMFIRGVADAMESSSSLKVVFEDQAQESDLVMEGHIIQMSKPSTFKRWVMQKKKMELGIKGRLIDKASNRTVAVFTDDQVSKSAKLDHRQLGLMLGQDVGKFLLSEKEK